MAAGAGAAALAGQENGAAALLSRGDDAPASRGDPGGAAGHAQVEAARGVDDAESEDGIGDGDMSESSTTPPLPSQPPRPDELEKQVAELTAWRGEETQLWKKAVETTEGEGKEPWVRRFMARPMRVNAVGIAAVLLVGVFVVGLLLPSLGQARHAARQLKDGTQVRGVVGGMSTFAGKHTVGELGVASGADAEASKPGYGRGMIDLAGGVAGRGGAATSIPDEIEGAYVLNNLASAQVIIRAPGGSQSDSDRQVVRKATIELTSDDVRGTFAKAAHLASEAGGEYVENSSLTGEGKTAQGNLTLRVAATRLGALMTSLRELGVVKAENTTGEDVTAQVVD